MTLPDVLLRPGARPPADAWWGVVVAASCGDRGAPPGLAVRARRRTGTWEMLLVEVPDAGLDRAVAELQDHMLPVAEECWYAHLFRAEEMVVVYQDRAFRVRTDPGTWSEPIEHGRRHGVPDEQLDFDPRTVPGAHDRFGHRGTHAAEAGPR